MQPLDLQSVVSGIAQCHAGQTGRSLQLYTWCHFKPFNFDFHRTLHFSLLRPKTWKCLVHEARHCAKRKSGN